MVIVNFVVERKCLVVGATCNKHGGFDFLGYHFSPEGLSMAEKTIEKFLARAVRLYEQEQGEPFGSPRLGS